VGGLTSGTRVALRSAINMGTLRFAWRHGGEQWSPRWRLTVPLEARAIACEILRLAPLAQDRSHVREPQRIGPTDFPARRAHGRLLRFTLGSPIALIVATMDHARLLENEHSH